MSAPLFIAGKLSFKGRMAMVSIAVSFFVMILAVAISSGFRKEIRDALSNLSGDISITAFSRNSGAQAPAILQDSALVAGILDIRGVDRVEAAVYDAAIAKNGDNIHGIILKGVETSDSASMDVIVPSRLAQILQLETGDRMLCHFIGEKVVLRNFTVSGIYDGINAGDDRMVVFCDISTLRRVRRMASDELSAYEVVLDDDCRDDSDAIRVNNAITFLLYQKNEKDDTMLVSTRLRSAYPQLFEWLDLIGFNVFFILVLMVIVAGFNMVSGLLILLFEHVRTIGLLKSLGMQFKDIAATFLLVSARLVLYGMLAGNAAAFLFCLIEDKTHFFRMNPENYFVSSLPVNLDVLSVLACDAAAFVVIMLILLIPCAFISRIDPARSMRTE